MLKTNTRHYAYVSCPDGRIKAVKNLGWLLRNWARVTKLEWVTTNEREGYPRWQGGGLFRAHLYDGRIYRTDFADFRVWVKWINRPVFQGLPTVVDGVEGKV